MSHTDSQLNILKHLYDSSTANDEEQEQVRRLYTLEEIHRYNDEIRKTEGDFWAAIKQRDIEKKNQIEAQLHVMREVLTRMHESLEKYGPYRPGFIGRMFAAHEIRKSVEALPHVYLSAGRRPELTKTPEKSK